MDLVKTRVRVDAAKQDYFQYMIRSSSRATYHVYTLHLFTCNDLLDIVFMPFFFAMAMVAAGPTLGLEEAKSPLEVLHKAPIILLWSWANLLLCTIHNQRHPESIAEDTANKPWRPIPSKRLKPEDCPQLLCILYPVVISYSLVIGGVRPCLLIALWDFCYNEWNGSQNLILRNVINATALSTFLSGPLEIVVGNHATLLQYPILSLWVCIIGAIIFTTIQVQDFRDFEGDSIQGRKTLPIVLGDFPARVLTAAAIMAWSCFVPVFWKLSVFQFVPTITTGSLMAGHLLFRRSLEADKLTYRMWSFWMVSFFICPLIKMYG